MDDFPLDQSAAFAVLLLHGLYAKADELKPIAAKLDKQFGKTVLIIEPTCRIRLKSVIRSIDQQAAAILKWTQLQLMAYSKEPRFFPLIIIGYSQGGVLAYTLGKDYKSQLNIVGIITLNAPLMGTPFLERSRRDIEEFISNAKEGLQLMAYPLSRIKQRMALQAWLLHLTRPRWIPINGLKDILPSSACIKGIHRFLHDNSAIPCLLIATHQHDFSELFYIKTVDAHRAIERLNDAYALLITGEKGGRHDTLIPLASQLGRSDDNQMSITMNNPNNKPISMVWPNRPHIKSRIYNRILHASNLVAIDPNLFVDRGETVLYADLILTDIIQFIQQLL